MTFDGVHRHSPRRAKLIAVVFVVLAGTSLGLAQSTSQLPFHAKLDAEANPTKATNLLWDSAFTKCGDSAFFLEKRMSGVRLIEFKGPFKSEFRAISLSRADQLNGIQASGTAWFAAEASRWIDTGEGSAGIPPHRPAWSEWSGPAPGRPAENAIGTMLSSLNISMTRKSGHWELAGPNVDSFSDELMADKITCEVATTARPFDRYRVPRRSSTVNGGQPIKSGPEKPKALFVCAGTEILSIQTGERIVVTHPMPVERVIMERRNVISIEIEGRGYDVRREQQPRETCLTGPQ